MELIPDVHLEDWDSDDETIFVKDNLMISIEEGRNILSIKDMSGTFREIKEITQYWELESLNYFINSEYNSDSDQDTYQREFSSYIRDIYLKYDYLVIHNINKRVFGTNDLFDCKGWTNTDLERLWVKGIITIIDINDTDDIYPIILTDTCWDELRVIKEEDLMGEYRDISLEELL